MKYSSKRTFSHIHFPASKMTKKFVKESTYQILNAIFYSFCLFGLIWQEVQISINFFQFNVIKDIKIFMPEEVENIDKNINLCFPNHEILDYESYQKIFPVKSEEDLINDFSYIETESIEENIRDIPLSGRFKVSMSYNRLIHQPFRKIEEFILDKRYCYQITDEAPVLISELELTNVTLIEVSKGSKLPIFDPYRLIPMKLNVPMLYRYFINVTSYTYNIFKLDWPYSDNCIHYEYHGFVDQNDAVVKCVNGKIFHERNELFIHTLIQKKNIEIYPNDTKYSKDLADFTLKGDCKRKYQNFDCNRIFYQTELSIKETKIDPKIDTFDQTHFIYISLGTDKEASMYIESKPRIEKIDYVTYILGALGSWLGFSFIGINPIPFLLKFENDPSEGEPPNDEKRIRSHEREMARMKIQLLNLRHEISINRSQIQVIDQRTQNLQFDPSI